MGLRNEKLGRGEDRRLHRRRPGFLVPITKCGRSWLDLDHTKFAHLRWPETFCGECFAREELRQEGLTFGAGSR